MNTDLKLDISDLNGRAENWIAEAARSTDRLAKIRTNFAKFGAWLDERKAER